MRTRYNIKCGEGSFKGYNLDICKRHAFQWKIMECEGEKSFINSERMSRQDFIGMTWWKIYIENEERMEIDQVK